MPRSQHAAPKPGPVSMGACSPARTHRGHRSLARCFARSPLVPKHSPATMHVARYSYLSLTSAGVASDLPFVTLRGNKHGLAKVRKKKKQARQVWGLLFYKQAWQVVFQSRDATNPAWLLHKSAGVLGLSPCTGNLGCAMETRTIQFTGAESRKASAD